MSTARNPTTNAADISGMQFIRNFEVDLSGQIVASNGDVTVKKYLQRDPLDIAYYKELPYKYWTNGVTNNDTYRSRDSVTWENVPQTGMPLYPYSFSKIEFFDGAMYKLGNNYVMYKSLDSGSTWTPSTSAFYGTIMVSSPDALWDISVNKYTVDSSTNTWSTATAPSFIPNAIIYWQGKYVACGRVDDGEYYTRYACIAVNDSPTGTWQIYQQISQPNTSYAAMFVANGNLHLVKGSLGWDSDLFRTVHIGSTLPTADDFTETFVGSSHECPDQSVYMNRVIVATDGANKGVAMLPVENYEYYGVKMVNLFNINQVIMYDTEDQIGQEPSVYYSSENQKFHVNGDWSATGVQHLEASASDITTWTTETTAPLATRYKMSINNG
jgi:hypothetical protein